MKLYDGPAPSPLFFFFYLIVYIYVSKCEEHAESLEYIVMTHSAHTHL